MADDLVSIVNNDPDTVTELQKLIESSREQYDLPPYVNPDDYEAWKQEKVNHTTHQQLLRDKHLNLEQTYTGRERYLERLSTYSTAFICNKTPVSPDQCAMHGWIDTKECHVISDIKVFRLSCQQCSCVLDVPNLTNVRPNLVSVKRIYSIYPSLLNKNHSEVCFWHTASCDVSVCAFPLVTTSDALALLETQGGLLKQLDKRLPLVKTDYDLSKKRMLHRVIKYIEGVDVFAFPQPQITMIQETAYLLPMFGWRLMKENNSPLLECNCCFKHVMIPNYLLVDDLPASDGTFGSLSHLKSTRPECIKGAFDPINEHLPYCPWRNRDIARRHLKDSHFVPPKQPLNGCEWMLEMVCKEWFKLTSDDDKNSRHNEFRQAALRHITTSIANNRWMLEDLSKRAVSRSSLKRGLSETDNGSFTEDASLSKKGKRQGDVEQQQDLDQQNIVLTEDKSIATQAVNGADLQITLAPAEQPTHTEGYPSSTPTTTITEPTVQQPRIVSLGSATGPQESSMAYDGETTAEEITEGTTPIKLDAKDELVISTTASPVSGEILEPEQHIQKLDIEEDLDMQLDKAAEEQDMKTGVFVSTATSNDNVNNTLTSTEGALDTSTNNNETTTGIDIEDVKDSTATLDSELEEVEENLQQGYKEDFGLTLNGDNVSTPGSWGIVDTDNMATSLDDDAKAEDELLETEERETMDNQQEQDGHQKEELNDVQQNETENLISAPTMDNTDHRPSSPSKDDLDQHTELETDHVNTTSLAHEKQSDDAVTQDESKDEQEILQAPYADDTHVETMELDQDENDQIKQDATELDLDEFDGMTSSTVTESAITTADTHQPLGFTNLNESNMQLENVTTPQEFDNDHVMTPQELTGDNALLTINDDDTTSQSIPTNEGIPADQGADKDHVSIAEDEHHNGDKEGTAEDMDDESGPTALQQGGDDADPNLLTNTEEAQPVTGGAGDEDGGAKNDEQQVDKNDEDLAMNTDDGNLEGSMTLLDEGEDKATEPSELDYDTDIMESKAAGTSSGLVSTPIIAEQDDGDVEEYEETLTIDDHQATTEDQDALIDEQLDEDMNDTENLQTPLAQESATTITIEVTNEDDTHIIQDNATEIEELKDEYNDNTREQTADLTQPDQHLESVEAPNTPNDTDLYNDLNNNDYEVNDNDMTSRNDLDDHELLDQNDGTEEPDLNPLDDTGNNEEVEDYLDQHTTKSVQAPTATDSNVQEEPESNPLNDTGNDDAVEAEDSLDQDTTEPGQAPTTTNNKIQEEPGLNPLDGTGNDDEVEDSLDQHTTEPDHDIATAVDDLVDETIGDPDAYDFNDTDQPTTEHSLPFEKATTDIVTDPAMPTVAATSTLQPPATQRKDTIDLDQEISNTPPMIDDDRDDTQENTVAVESMQVPTTTDTPLETREDHPPATNVQSQRSYEEEDITQDDFEKVLPADRSLMPSSTKPPAATNPETLDTESSNSNNRDTQEDDVLAVDNEAEFDMEDLQDDDNNTTTNDPSTILHSSQIRRQLTNITDDDMLDPQEEEDQLMQYEDDSNRNDEPMLDQDDLMEE